MLTTRRSSFSIHWMALVSCLDRLVELNLSIYSTYGSLRANVRMAVAVAAEAAARCLEESSDSEPEQEHGSPQKLIRKVSTSGQIRSKVIHCFLFMAENGQERAIALHICGCPELANSPRPFNSLEFSCTTELAGSVFQTCSGSSQEAARDITVLRRVWIKPLCITAFVCWRLSNNMRSGTS